MTQHPANPKKLSATKWTSAVGLFDYRHWEVSSVDGDDAVLTAVLNADSTMRIPWRDLRDRDVWAPGWNSTRSADAQDSTTSKS